MPRFRIHRMKDAPSENFRWSAHTGGVAVVKPKDYEPSGEVEAPTSYAAWKMLTVEGRPLRPGDVLEALGEASAPGELQIAKYIGFEPAKWYAPEPKLSPEVPAAEAAPSGESISLLT